MSYVEEKPFFRLSTQHSMWYAYTLVFLVIEICSVRCQHVLAQTRLRCCFAHTHPESYMLADAIAQHYMCTESNFAK